jgi:hypothetical protein
MESLENRQNKAVVAISTIDYTYRNNYSSIIIIFTFFVLIILRV